MLQLDLNFNILELKKLKKLNLEYLKPGFCYELINEMVDKNLITNDKFIAYGYVKDGTGFTFRHCYLIDENEKIIDPAILLGDGIESFQKYGKFIGYHTLKVMNVNDFKENRDLTSRDRTDFKDILLDDERDFLCEMLQTPCRINSYDYKTFIKEILISMDIDVKAYDNSFIYNELTQIQL